MRTTITKEVTLCDYCGEEITTNSHRFDDQYDLHAQCMKNAVVECLESRPVIRIPQESRPMISPKEQSLIHTCLDYCWHRITQHGKTIAKEEEIDALRKKLRK